LRYFHLFVILWLSCQFVVAQSASHINGLSFVAPPSQFEEDPMTDVMDVHANWIAVIPYAYTRMGQTTVRHNVSSRQWWGERPEGVRKTITLAHAKGLRVMLKPQVYIPGSWPGALSYDHDSLWHAWEQSYRSYILTYVEIAREMSVAMVCIGTEFRESVRQRPQFWEQLIRDIRARYNGQLTYAANWDDYKEVSFWDRLDLIGVDAYFPLLEEDTPAVWDLNLKWQPIMADLQKYSDRFRRQVLFTEFGYYSVDGCAGKHWELAEGIHSRKINELAQCNALEALLTTCASYPCWAGGFLWKWFPNGHGHEGYFERDFTPQGKLAEEKLKKIYSNRLN
jgi:hypothetical protein